MRQGQIQYQSLHKIPRQGYDSSVPHDHSAWVVRAAVYKQSDASFLTGFFKNTLEFRPSRYLLKSIVAIRPKPPFKPVFQVAASKEGTGIRIVNEPYLGSSVFLVEAGESRTPRPKEAAPGLLQA